MRRTPCCLWKLSEVTQLSLSSRTQFDVRLSRCQSFPFKDVVHFSPRNQIQLKGAGESIWICQWSKVMLLWQKNSEPGYWEPEWRHSFEVTWSKIKVNLMLLNLNRMNEWQLQKSKIRQPQSSIISFLDPSLVFWQISTFQCTPRTENT